MRQARAGAARSDAPGARRVRSAELTRLKPELDRLYDQYDFASRVADPIEIARRFDDPADREVVAFCAAALAFGRVASVLQSIERVLAVMQPSPVRFLERFDPERDTRLFDGIGHRWIRARDLAALAWVLAQMIRRRGSIEAFFLDGYDPTSTDVRSALDAFSTSALGLDLAAIYGRRMPACPGVRYFFPSPSRGSACKRLNLFLRWMVRSDRVDFGLWRRVPASKLVIPLDTHIVRLGRCLRLTAYTAPGWRMAADITDTLRGLDPDDPVKYDFSLCHVGMMDACGFRRSYRDARCPLRGFCHPAERRARASRRPSVRH